MPHGNRLPHGETLMACEARAPAAAGRPAAAARVHLPCPRFWARCSMLLPPHLPPGASRCHRRRQFNSLYLVVSVAAAALHALPAEHSARASLLSSPVYQELSWCKPLRRGPAAGPASPLCLPKFFSPTSQNGAPLHFAAPHLCKPRAAKHWCDPRPPHCRAGAKLPPARPLASHCEGSGAITTAICCITNTSANMPRPRTDTGCVRRATVADFF